MQDYSAKVYAQQAKSSAALADDWSGTVGAEGEHGAKHHALTAKSLASAASAFDTHARFVPVGGTHIGYSAPAAGTWIECGSVYLQSSYPALFGLLGLLPNDVDYEATWASGANLPANTIWRIGYGDGVFVAIHGSTPSLSRRSTDRAASWSSMSSPPPNGTWRQIAHGAGVFVTVSSGSAGSGDSVGAWSTDGSSWNTSTMPSSSQWGPVTYGDGAFVALSSGYVQWNGEWYSEAPSNKCARSTDNGQTWAAFTLPASRLWGHLAFGDGVFVAVATGATATETTSNAAAYSTDGGQTWTASTLPSSQRWSSLAYGDGVFVVVAGSINDASNKSAYSTDGGVSWTAVDLPASRAWTVVYASGAFFALAYGATAYSTNGGATWTETAGTGLVNASVPSRGATDGDVIVGVSTANGAKVKTIAAITYDPTTQFYVPKMAGLGPLKQFIRSA